LRVVEYDKTVQVNVSDPHQPRPPAAHIAAKLIPALRGSDTSIVYVALSESMAAKIAQAVQCLDPELDLVILPPWDCLPYDRVPPSRQSMGRRMDALRVWSQASPEPRLMITSLDAVLQRIPPSSVIDGSWYQLVVGTVFDEDSFRRFVGRAGYIEQGVADEPGEIAFRDDVIDIFPAGALRPMRIVLAEDGTVSELRSYDPVSQRTEYTVEKMVFGPASEAILPDASQLDDNDGVRDGMERRLFQLYGQLQTVFDILGKARVSFAADTPERLSTYLEIIDEARQAHRDFGGAERSAGPSLYLDHGEWHEATAPLKLVQLDLDGGRPSPVFTGSVNPRKAFAEWVKVQTQTRQTVVTTGNGRLFENLCRRLERANGSKPVSIAHWDEAAKAAPGSLLTWQSALERGFVDGASGVAVITAADVLGASPDAVSSSSASALLEPELALSDVVVHEDHGVGLLSDLESVVVEEVARDAARLEYRDGASILVPMDEFGKLWRYGSEPGAVTLDRLHTDGWAKKRAAVAKDIRLAARHLLRLAKEREQARADVIVPPRADYAKFVSRFPYMETADQAAAIDAVLQDLGSGTVMNRLVCGDVGFGKTEVALRAAAAVALGGGQVVVIAPTTVLARQHFTTFERRFAATGIEVAMLSRVVATSEAKRIKAGLKDGEIGIVVATQAILAKDVAFNRLELLIIDEEHRFGTRDKAAMAKMAPLLHTLTMSATPIPRTLQAAMVGVQDVSLLTTPPSKRRPVRTSLSDFDRASARVALMREHRRGGQSFFVAPQIEDLGELEAILKDVVPELSVRVAHGKMPAAAMDEVMVGFADGDGDILLSTNIIESGLDVPRANTIFVWRADRFGLAQLHQLRGRVGRGKTQGLAYLLTPPEEDISEETRLRLSTMVENDRLGAGLAISIQDLDLRGGGDIVGEDQAGHMKVFGISLYQKLLERAVAAARKQQTENLSAPAINLGIVGTIPVDYVPDATVRLNLYARLLRAASMAEIDGFTEEFEDRFGELPDEVSILLRLAGLKIAAASFGICKLDAGPRAMAVSFGDKPPRKLVKLLSAGHAPVERDDRLIYEKQTDSGLERIEFFEQLLKSDW
jgi:transcription-repair coupling factor (superfamily II helicase)